MAKGSNQKLKMIYLAQYLMRNTDEKHPVTIAQMIDHLKTHDIPAERKSLYSDIEALRDFGLDIIKDKSKTTGYYIGSRDFETAELKLLVDSVQSSKFITHNKTLALIKKIENLASVHDAHKLQRQIHICNRVKTSNTTVYYSIDTLHNAMSSNKQIAFKYYEYTIAKVRRQRRDGGDYIMSPFSLIWDDENYYLLAWDEEISQFRHFRVDKMNDIRILPDSRLGTDEFGKLDMSAYSKMTFGMYAGTVQNVRMRFANQLAGVVFDRFGMDTIVAPDGDKHFTFTCELAPSPTFYGWIATFGKDAEILSPASVREEMKNRINQIAELYK